MAALQAKLLDLQQKIAPLTSELDKTRQQIQLVGRLLGLENGQTGAAPGPPPPVSNGASVGDILVEILAAEGEPLHVGDLKVRFLSRGHTIPGKGTDSNLIAYLTRDPRFVRVARGTYALAALAVRAPQRKRRKGRRRSSRTRKRG